MPPVLTLTEFAERTLRPMLVNKYGEEAVRMYERALSAGVDLDIASDLLLAASQRYENVLEDKRSLRVSSSLKVRLPSEWRRA